MGVERYPVSSETLYRDQISTIEILPIMIPIVTPNVVLRLS